MLKLIHSSKQIWPFCNIKKDNTTLLHFLRSDNRFIVTFLINSFHYIVMY
eukprot:14526.XXX_659685_659515_1 [CDS] Oithona nana genome sequencing.